MQDLSTSTKHGRPEVGTIWRRRAPPGQCGPSPRAAASWPSRPSQAAARGRPSPGSRKRAPVFRTGTEILHVCLYGFDSIRIMCSRGELPKHPGTFPEKSTQRIVVCEMVDEQMLYPKPPRFLPPGHLDISRNVYNITTFKGLYLPLTAMTCLLSHCLQETQTSFP